jgi:predicted nucleic acid-binding protein
VTVICNATPLINFAAINRLDILKDVFGEVLIPQAVYDETTVSGYLWSQFILQAVASGWLQVRNVSNIDPIISPELDDGEREAIALALETGIHKILLDEQDARKVAQSVGLRLIGTLGILLLAKEKQIIDEIKPLLDAMIDVAQYWVNAKLYEQVLKQAGELI